MLIFQDIATHRAFRVAPRFPAALACEGMKRTSAMSNLFFPVTPAGTPEIERPAPDRVIAGDPVFTSWTLEDRDGLYCGIWESTPGTWRDVL
jgi:hypothetical protein